MPEQARRLLQKADVVALLQLPESKIDWLINTHQIRALRLCGEERIDSHEIDRLIETYKQIAERKDPHVQQEPEPDRFTSAGRAGSGDQGRDPVA